MAGRDGLVLKPKSRGGVTWSSSVHWAQFNVIAGTLSFTTQVCDDLIGPKHCKLSKGPV